MNINIIKGDITKVRADVIVNAANTELRGGGGVDGAIHKAAGPKLLGFETWMYPHGTQVAVPVVTPAFGELPAKYIIHVPGPDARCTIEAMRAIPRGRFIATGWNKLDGQLWHAYARSLVLAGMLGAGTVTFPSLSTGIYAFPLNRAVLLALGALRKHAKDAPSVHSVGIVAFDDKTFDAFKAALDA